MSLSVKAAAAFHWFGVDYAAGDPVDTSGYDARALTRLLRKAPVYVVDGDGVGGSAPVGVGDFMTWTREGATDGDSASFDFTVDVKESAGTSIVVEDDADFISNYGYALPKITVAGAFSIGFGGQMAAPGDTINCVINLVDQTGNSYLEPHESASLFFRCAAYVTSDLAGVAGTHTVYLPAGAHIDLSLATSADPADLALFIQKVG